MLTNNFAKRSLIDVRPKDHLSSFNYFHKKY